MKPDLSMIDGNMMMTRRKLLQTIGLGMAGWAASAAASTYLYASLVEPARFDVHEQPIHLPRLKGEGLLGLRIAQISDIHMGGWMTLSRLKRVVDLILARSPEIVFITGDFLSRRQDSSDLDVLNLAAALEPLSRSVATFAVMGNHDHWRGVGPLREMLAEIHVQELRNSVVSVKRGDSLLHLAGVDDVWEGHHRLDPVLSSLPPEGAAILLAHEPDYVDTVEKSKRFDMQISGHTHGGQIVIPFYGPPVLPWLGEKYPSGLYQVGSMWQYTNRGVGMSSLALRFNCPPEITIFTLTA
jgi:predicted MPP superfamily phosphohydrolase